MGTGEAVVPGLLDAMRGGCHLAGWLLTAEVRARVLELIGDVSPNPSVGEDYGRELWSICWCRLANWPGRGGDVLGRVARAVLRDVEEQQWGGSVLLGSAVEGLVAPVRRAPEELLRDARRRGILRTDQCRLLIQVDVIGMSCSELARRDGGDEVRLRRQRRTALAALARDPGMLGTGGWLAAG